MADDGLLLRADLLGVRFDAAGELDDDALGLVEPWAKDMSFCGITTPD